MKTCRICKEPKPLEEFSAQKGSRDGHRNTCKLCSNDYHRNYYNINTDHLKYKDKVYRDSNQSKIKLTKRIGALRRKYNLTLEEAEEIYSRGCEICGSREKLNIDHCHETGEVRGCLCFNCNIGIGKFKDSLSLLDKAKDYLRQYIIK